MIPLRVDVGPAHQTTHTNTAYINLSILPGPNFPIERTNPLSVTNSFVEPFISISELSWYTKGLTIWSNVNEFAPVEFSLELHPSQLIAAGLQISVSVQTGEIEPFSLFFPPGTLPCRGYRIHLDLNDCMKKLIDARTRASHLFQHQYSQFIAPINQHTPIASTSRAVTSVLRTPTHRVRETELQLNRQRQEHLYVSRLF